MTSEEDGTRDPGERRLASYLEELREDPPRSEPALARQVSRSARWQRAVRDPLLVAGHLAGAVAEGIATILGKRPRVDR